MKSFLLALAPIVVFAQQEKTLSIEEYTPKSTLVVPHHSVKRAKYPFIDVHNHQRGEMPQAKLDQLVKEMDELNMGVMVNLSGSYGDRFKKTYDNMKGHYPNRFVVFANMDFSDLDAPEYAKKVADQFEKDVKNGAQGLKIFKNFGMDMKDTKGQRIHVDDPRFDGVFELCAKYHLPVLIHTAEPAAFFEPQDKFNERWLELKQFPSRARPSSRYPSWQTLMDEHFNLIAKHPKTIFISAHLAWMGGNLDELGRRLDKYPNMMTEIAAVVAELGRQPKHARAFFTKYQDRILFGKDTYEPVEYHTYFQLFETDDEYFDYFRKRHAFWQLYGLDLPDDVLRKFYYKNALRIIPGIDASRFPK